MAPTTILEESEAEWAKDFCYATLAFDGSPVQIASTAKHAQAPNFPPNIESRASGDIITRLFIPASRSPILRQVCRNRGTPRTTRPDGRFSRSADMGTDLQCTRFLRGISRRELVTGARC